MLAKRIVPCLDVKDGKVVKGVNFRNLRDIGDPVEHGAFYSSAGADELVYLDITATNEKRKLLAGLVRRIAETISIPFTVGGGIIEIDDAVVLLDAGADKISVNSAALVDPGLIDRIAALYGSQFIVLAIDAKEERGVWKVYAGGGTRPTGRELFSWAREVQERGAGEILFTSMNHDGTKKGYACKTLAALSDILSIPLIASGGAGRKEHFAEVFTKGNADAALAASVFHYREIEIDELKKELHEKNIPVRL